MTSEHQAVDTGIVAFIEARLDERERDLDVEDAVWAGVIAKDRAILALHRPEGYSCRVCDPSEDPGHIYPCQTVRLLAAIDADHPDFDPSWKPVAT